MFERFTERARQVVVLAQDEARDMHHSYIGTEHILLGLIREWDGVAAKALNNSGVLYHDVNSFIKNNIGIGVKPSPTGQLPFTPACKKNLENALREALALGHNYIGTEHVLLGLARDTQTTSGKILFGELYTLSPDDIRNEVIRIISEPKAKKLEAKDKWSELRKNVEESLKEGGRPVLVPSPTKAQVTITCGSLTLQIEEDTSGHANILITKPSDLNLTISQK